jgi:NADPH-dependent glutamate synthase beta subunit-like oxidoreductase
MGSPPYRLPREVLDLELKKFHDLGVKLQMGTRVESVESLLSDGYNAVFLGLGAHKEKKMGIPGEEDSIDGLGLLREFNFKGRIKTGQNVAIIGGGNVALDVARMLIRENRRHVTIFYRRTKEEMPAFREEVEAALEEGIVITFQSAPLIIEKKNQLLRIQFMKMRMSDEMDESGRRTPLPVHGSEYWLTFDDIVSAVGELPDIPDGMKDLIGEDGRIWVDPETRMTKRERVFAGGDVVTGPRTAVEAVGAGKKAAVSIDRFLGGRGEIEWAEDASYFKPRWGFNEGGKALPDVLCVRDRLQGFFEVISAMEKEEAEKEARRCLRCSFRFMIPNAIYPPEEWMPIFENNILGVPEEEGVYQLFDGEKRLHKVVGTENLREALLDEFRSGSPAKFFSYEKEIMYTSRERQIIQQYLKENGKLPPGNDEMEELF